MVKDVFIHYMGWYIYFGFQHFTFEKMFLTLHLYLTKPACNVRSIFIREIVLHIYHSSSQLKEKFNITPGKSLVIKVLFSFQF
jgi:hypothetical protein